MRKSRDGGMPACAAPPSVLRRGRVQHGHDKPRPRHTHLAPPALRYPSPACGGAVDATRLASALGHRLSETVARALCKGLAKRAWRVGMRATDLVCQHTDSPSTPPSLNLAWYCGSCMTSSSQRATCPTFQRPTGTSLHTSAPVSAVAGPEPSPADVGRAPAVESDDGARESGTEGGMFSRTAVAASASVVCDTGSRPVASTRCTGMSAHSGSASLLQPRATTTTQPTSITPPALRIARDDAIALRHSTHRHRPAGRRLTQLTLCATRTRWQHPPQHPRLSMWRPPAAQSARLRVPTRPAGCEDAGMCTATPHEGLVSEGLAAHVSQPA